MFGMKKKIITPLLGSEKSLLSDDFSNSNKEYEKENDPGMFLFVFLFCKLNKNCNESEFLHSLYGIHNFLLETYTYVKPRYSKHQSKSFFSNQ